MPILRERISWSRPKVQRGPDLSPDEQKAVKVALRFLAKRHGSVAKLAEAMAVKRATVQEATTARGAVTAGVALKAARVAGAPMEDVLAGRWPRAGACPYCGREGG